MTDIVKNLIEHTFNFINQEEILANTWRDYDAIDVPLPDFPLLCGYRLSAIYPKKTTDSRITTVAITYSLSYPQLKEIPNRLKITADKINEAIINYEYLCNCFFVKSSISANFGLRKFELTNSIYPFLQMTANIGGDC